MSFVVPIGRYLGLMSASSIERNILPIEDVHGQYAVLEVPRGTIPAPPEYAPFFQIASRAPDLAELAALLDATPHDQGITFTNLFDDHAIFVVDEESGIPDGVLDELIIKPNLPVTKTDPQPEGLSSDGDISVFETATGRFVSNEHVIAGLAEAGAAGVTLRTLVVALADRLGDGDLSRARYIWTRALRELVAFDAVYVMLQV